MKRTILLLLFLASIVIAAALVASLACRNCYGSNEKFENSVHATISAKDLPVVQGVDGNRYDRIEVLDGSQQELGWCLAIDGRIQMCQADTHKYHEMLVQFACAVRDLGPKSPSPKKPNALILFGGDGLALAQVEATGHFERIVVLEDETGIAEVSEHFEASRTSQKIKSSSSSSNSVEKFDGNIKRSLQRHWPDSFDLIVIDLKDRWPTPEEKPFLSRATCRQLARLLAPGGVLSVGSMLPGNSEWKGGIEELFDEKCFPHRLPFTFYSEVRSDHVKMELFAEWDMNAAIQEGDAPQKKDEPPTHAPHAKVTSSSTHSTHPLKFFDATKSLKTYVVPWFASL